MPARKVIPGILRFAAVAGLGVWLGGTVIHGALVVPTAHDVMGSHREIGFVTRDVTGTLNLLGAAVLVLLLAHAVLSLRGRSRGYRTGLLVSWAIMAVAQAALFLMRASLDGMLDPGEMRILDPDRFPWLHERYLNVTSALCLAGLVHLGFVLAAPPPPPPPLDVRA